MRCGPSSGAISISAFLTSAAGGVPVSASNGGTAASLFIVLHGQVRALGWGSAEPNR